MKTILHLDGDGFFAACEISLNPKLKGKAVVTGQERGIATAMSREAKALGVHRGMPIYMVKKLYPEAVVVNSNYHSYGMFAQRMYDIVRRYTPLVEEYSIDECFADISDLPDPVRAAENIKKELKRELGITFSLGIGPTKVIAKVASKWNKPDGFTVIQPDEIENFLKDLHIGKVWGIGPATSTHLQRLGIQTALDFTQRDERWVRENLPKPEHFLWHELRGHSVYRVHHEPDDDYGSIQQTRTFTPSTKLDFLFSELSKNVEGACMKARRHELSTRRVYYFLKTQEFRYHRFEVPLTVPTNDPSVILNEIRATVDRVYKQGFEYRATGVTLSELVPESVAQNDLFGEVVKNDKKREVWKISDLIDRRYGTHTMILASSLRAREKRRTRPARRLWIPSMGEVA
ncbi:MAG: polymerase [Parcubacteria group bacterium]|nr:polymerase [Parcubacteria group bacterium]